MRFFHLSVPLHFILLNQGGIFFVSKFQQPGLTARLIPLFCFFFISIIIKYYIYLGGSKYTLVDKLFFYRLKFCARSIKLNCLPVDVCFIPDKVKANDSLLFCTE